MLTAPSVSEPQTMQIIVIPANPLATQQSVVVPDHNKLALKNRNKRTLK